MIASNSVIPDEVKTSSHETQAPTDYKLIVETNGDLWAATTAPITVCDDGSYCCGDNGYAPKANPNGPVCCSAGKGVWIVDGKTTFMNPNNSTLNPSSLSSISTSSQSTSLLADPTSAMTTTNPQQNNPSNASKTGAISGGVVGGIAGLAVVVLAVWYFMMKRNRKHALPPSQAFGQGDVKQSFDVDV